MRLAVRLHGREARPTPAGLLPLPAAPSVSPVTPRRLGGVTA